MAGRFIDKLKKAARLEPVKKEIILDNGEDRRDVRHSTDCSRTRARQERRPLR